MSHIRNTNNALKNCFAKRNTRFAQSKVSVNIPIIIMHALKSMEHFLFAHAAVRQQC